MRTLGNGSFHPAFYKILRSLHHSEDKASVAPCSWGEDSEAREERPKSQGVPARKKKQSIGEVQLSCSQTSFLETSPGEEDGGVPTNDNCAKSSGSRGPLACTSSGSVCPNPTIRTADSFKVPPAPSRCHMTDLPRVSKLSQVNWKRTEGRGISVYQSPLKKPVASVISNRDTPGPRG